MIDWAATFFADCARPARCPKESALSDGFVGNELTVSRIDGVSALLRFAADIDRLNAASSRPNAFASSAYSYTYALRNEYRLPGVGERLFLVREGAQIIGCAAMREVKQGCRRSRSGHSQFRARAWSSWPQATVKLRPSCARRLAAGEGVHIPPCHPHWVQNGPAVSISLGILWFSDVTARRRHLYRVNGWLERAGLHPPEPGEQPTLDASKALPVTLKRRLERALRAS